MIQRNAIQARLPGTGRVQVGDVEVRWYWNLGCCQLDVFCSLDKEHKLAIDYEQLIFDKRFSGCIQTNPYPDMGISKPFTEEEIAWRSGRGHLFPEEILAERLNTWFDYVHTHPANYRQMNDQEYAELLLDLWKQDYSQVNA